MFEKLREYGLYIIIGIISLSVLGLYFLSNINSKKGVKYFDDVQVGFLNATAINSTAKKEIKGTINDYIKLSNKQFGNYKINDDFGIVVLKGTNAKDAIIDGQFNISTKCDYLDKLYKDEEKKREIVNEKNLIQIIIPVNGDNLLNDSDIEGVKDETYIIKKNKIITCSGKEIDVKGKSPEERGFFDSALFGLGFFKDKSEAKGFKDKYLNANGMMIESDTTPFVVFDINGSIPNIMKTEYKSGNGNNDAQLVNVQEANENDEEKDPKFFFRLENIDHFKEEASSNCEYKIVKKNGEQLVELIFGKNKRCEIHPGRRSFRISELKNSSGYEHELDGMYGSEFEEEHPNVGHVFIKNNNVKSDVIVDVKMNTVCGFIQSPNYDGSMRKLDFDGYIFENYSHFGGEFETGNERVFFIRYGYDKRNNKFYLKPHGGFNSYRGTPKNRLRIENDEVVITFSMKASCDKDWNLVYDSIKVDKIGKYDVPKELLPPIEKFKKGTIIAKDAFIIKNINQYPLYHGA